MDYFVWGTVERDTNRASCNTKAELVARIKAVFAAIPRDMVVRACARFRKRVQAAIDTEGGTSNKKCGKHETVKFISNTLYMRCTATSPWHSIPSLPGFVGLAMLYAWKRTTQPVKSF
ncbi:uncharacterized protein LOC121603030 [Anopheles merus]|uniref:uncharacterized protein LOC121588865 n=1 Tax=Anopheles merus TaxID=30066 RepID=UPI001BE41CD6|nr:uncharacterized protein LOC121588865 [Anopheles merus]XP_041787702.1 uncharacterized protein LOC121603030 [Anopheles merus]